MNVFWNSVINPIFNRVKPDHIVEIRSEKANTKNILDYCKNNTTQLTVITHFPQSNLNEFKSSFGDKFKVYNKPSLDVLPLLDDYEIILINGDHNWYTVYNELKIIEKNFENKRFPLVILFGIGWPYGRRDQYFDPKNIPNKFTQPYKKLGIYPKCTKLAKKGGLNPDFYHSIYENNINNGVLTAIEDFMCESSIEFSFEKVYGFQGMGILFQKDDELEVFIKELISKSDIPLLVEEDRMNLYIKNLELKQECFNTKNILEEKRSIIDDLKNKLNISSNKLINSLNDSEQVLNNAHNSIDDKNKEIKQIQKLLQNNELKLAQYKRSTLKEKSHLKNLEKKEQNFKKLKHEVNNLNNNIYELEYYNNYRRSVINRLISSFPSFYILLKTKSGMKDALRNIKGYKAIKKNNLFDIGYYLKNNNDIRISGIDPLLHYIFHGFKENRKPNPKFDGNYYISKYSDVKKSKLNPLVHYSLYGIKEDRTPYKITDSQSFNKIVENKSELPKPVVNEQLNSKYISDLFFNAFQDSPDYVDLNDSQIEIFDDDVKLIAFYLPQFHPFPENDKWWGKGFTEWENVTKAVPLFLGHYQPHLPVDLGFYDLRLIETQKRQIELAKQYGIFGFCYYYYWFNGKKLMETPINNLIDNPKELDFPFCLCWANENWTRRWDGNDDDILISQEYSPEDDLAFIKNLKTYITDSRYIKVDNKPLILVYKPQLLPNPKNTFKIWRDYCKEEGIGELHILCAKRHDLNLKPEEYGLDGAYEFPPNYPHPTQLKENVQFFNEKYKPTVYDLEKFLGSQQHFTKEEDYEKFKTIIPYWDNTPRRLNDGQVYIGNPGLYKKWLKEAIEYTQTNLNESKQFVFINAWNEWAEGAHLEPDKKFGYAYLKATAESIIESRQNK